MAITNITVKKADGTTSVIYNALQGAPSDGIPATWACAASSPIRGNRHVLALQSKLNGTRTARRMDANYAYRVLQIIDGIETIRGSIPVTLSIPVPVWASDQDVAEAVDQALNLFGSTEFRSYLKSGYAPTGA